MSRVLCGVDLQAFTIRRNDFEPAGRECLACRERLVAGDVYTRVRLGPGTDPVERERARRGDAYNPVWGFLHWACATGEEE